jgi:FtsZ-binding cell division protein ZapB
MTITKIRTEITTLSYSDKIYLLQLLMQEIAKEESLNVKPEKHGQHAAEILRRMADRKALENISEPVEWQRKIRQDNVLDGRE